MNILEDNTAYLEIKNYESLSWDNLTDTSGSRSLSGWAGNVLNSAKEALSGAVSEGLAAIGESLPPGIDEGVIRVQYNPTSLKFHGSTHREPDKTQVQAQQQGITTIPSWGVLKLSVDLEFAASSVMDTSVADQMNAVLKMMQKSVQKEVVFSWANMSVEGKVTYMSGEYLSFYPSGLPKAGKISLQIETQGEPKKIQTKIEKMIAMKSEKLANTGKSS
jgi:hypothetical protein